MKLRVPPSPIIMSIFRSFEAAPTSINFTEVYSALQTRLVEGQENPLAIISLTKLYEVQKYCSLTNHVWDGFWMLGNSNMLLAQQSGAQAVRNAGALDACNLMAPLFEQYQKQLDASQKISLQLLQELQKLQKKQS